MCESAARTFEVMAEKGLVRPQDDYAPFLAGYKAATAECQQLREALVSMMGDAGLVALMRPEQLERNQAALAGGVNQHPSPQLQEAPTADDIVACFKSAGMNIELGATYSVRGQVAQLIEGVRSLFQIVSALRASK